MPDQALLQHRLATRWVFNLPSAAADVLDELVLEALHSYSEAISETTSLSESLAIRQTAAAPQSESVAGPAESTIARFGQQASLAETVAASEISSTTATERAAPTETLSLTGAQSARLGTMSGLVEEISSSPDSTIARVASREISNELLALVEISQASCDSSCSFIETVSLAESIAISHHASSTMSEASSSSESSSSSVAGHPVLVDEVTWSDDSTARQRALATPSESTSIFEISGALARSLANMRDDSTSSEDASSRTSEAVLLDEEEASGEEGRCLTSTTTCQDEDVSLSSSLEVLSTCCSSVSDAVSSTGDLATQVTSRQSLAATCNLDESETTHLSARSSESIDLEAGETVLALLTHDNLPTILSEVWSNSSEGVATRLRYHVAVSEVMSCSSSARARTARTAKLTTSLPWLVTASVTTKTSPSTPEVIPSATPFDSPLPEIVIVANHSECRRLAVDQTIMVSPAMTSMVTEQVANQAHVRGVPKNFNV